MRLLLLVFALVCFLVAAWLPAGPVWNRLVAGGLAALVASMIPWPV